MARVMKPSNTWEEKDCKMWEATNSSELQEMIRVKIRSFGANTQPAKLVEVAHVLGIHDVRTSAGDEALTEYPFEVEVDTREELIPTEHQLRNVNCRYYIHFPEEY